jgi:hypothetical protein
MELEFYAWGEEIALARMGLGLGLRDCGGKLGFEELAVCFGNCLVLLGEFERYTCLSCKLF